MRKTIAFLLVILIGGLVSAPIIEGAVLSGYVFYSYHDLLSTKGFIYFFTSSGQFCGIAEVNGLGIEDPPTLAWEELKVANITQCYSVAFTDAPGGFCPQNIGNLQAYYITTFCNCC